MISRRLLLALLLAVILILQLIKLQIGKAYETRGIDLYKTQTQIKLLDTQNMLLKQQLLEASALTTIHDKASKMGFVDSTNFMYIKVPTVYGGR